MNANPISEKRTTRAWDIRVRSALLISVTFFLLLTLFSLLTYFAIRSILITRSSGEILSELGSVAARLSDSLSSNQISEIIAQHSTTGETQIHYLILRQEAGATTTIYPSGKSDANSPPPTLAQTLTPGTIKLGRSHGELRLLTAVKRGPYLIAASAEYYFLSEVEESIIRVFGISLVIGLVFSFATGFGLSTLILQPLNIIIAAGERLAKLGLRDPERLPIPQRTRQFAKLATTINALLDERDNQVRRVHQFTADAAHELRTPLTVLKGELEVDLRIYNAKSQTSDRALASTNPLLNEVRASLESNLEEVEHLITMVEDLLYLSSFDEKSEDHEEPCELSAVIGSVARRLRPLSEAKEIELGISLSPHTVFAQRDQLSRLFYNLILNAIQYATPKSNVTVSEESELGEFCILIHNEGPAISEQDLPHVFDRFFRADRARSRTSGGAGLGLSIVKSICDANGYGVQVSSNANSGTTFRILFC